VVSCLFFLILQELNFGRNRVSTHFDLTQTFIPLTCGFSRILIVAASLFSKAQNVGLGGDTAAATTMEARFTDLCKVQALACCQGRTYG
jgi:hypothetical protein